MPGIELAAAGGHNLFMIGPPGTGKTMLARRLPSILPPLTPVEALEITRIHSAAGLHTGGALVCSRPFRAPHHTISASGLVGGGPSPLPGEVTLGHRGVVFLDELSEFARPSLEALRQPLEDGYVTVIRAQQVETFPSAFMLVAASNPCPCGRGEVPSCTCSGADIARHDRRLSGALLDRMDVMLNVERPTATAMRDQPGPSSAEVRERVAAARERQTARLAAFGLICNAQLTARLLRTAAGVTSAAWDLLYALHDSQGLSGRGQTRVLRVARTLADLDASDVVLPEHVGEAAGWRLQIPALSGALAA